MAERKDPSTGGIAAEPSSARQPRGSGSGGAGYARRGSGSGGGDGGGSRIGTSIMMVILVAGLAAAGWFIANQHQLLGQQEQALSDADKRIRLLEDRLRMTDEALSETGSEANEKITLWESEIRKLWAVSNERNKKWIKDNESGLAAQSKRVASIQTAQGELKAAVDRHDKAFAQQQDIIDQLASIELQFQQVTSSQRDLVDKVNAVQQTLASVRNDLSRRVAENEQAVTAIDAYRLQLNNRMNDLERRISASSLPGGR